MKHSEEHYKVRVHHLDPRGELSLPSMLKMMQDCSMTNAREMGASIGDDHMGNASWVLLRKELDIEKYPKLDDAVKVLTFPTGFHRVLAYRDYWMLDAYENVIAKATTTWALMDLDERKMIRVPQVFAAQDIDMPFEPLPQAAAKLKIDDSIQEVYQYKVGLYDIDWNNHVNNIILCKLMLQTLDVAFFKSHRLKRFAYHIKAECKLDEHLSILGHKEAIHESLHMIRDQDGVCKAQAIATWK